MEQQLSLDMVRVTEAAALASARFMGRGEKDDADQSAVEAMRRTMDEIDFAGSLLAPGWTISFRENHSEDPLETFLRGGSSQTFPLCSDLQPAGNRTTLAIHQLSFP